MSRTILFLCPHNAAKSVIAIAYFRQLAERYELDFRAGSAGTDPDAAVWPAIIELLRAEGLEVRDEPPCRVSAQDLDAAYRIISLGCAATELGIAEDRIEHWHDVPLASQDLPGSRDAIRVHVERLIGELRAQ
jgi:protein-tyrosine-phosphatase